MVAAGIISCAHRRVQRLTLARRARYSAFALAVLGLDDREVDTVRVRADIVSVNIVAARVFCAICKV
eukprot:4236631-Prymnesium_polylepis.2